VKQKLEPGAVFDFTTPGELEEHLNVITRQSAQERARGVQPWRGDGSAGVSGAAVRIPALGSMETIGIDPGWAVRVYNMRAQGLAGSDVLSIYRNVVDDLHFVGQCTVAAPVESFGSNGLLLKGGEQLIFAGASLTATGDVSVNGEGTQVPETELYKLLTA
jgi:hypothetical protein